MQLRRSRAECSKVHNSCSSQWRNKEFSANQEIAVSTWPVGMSVPDENTLLKEVRAIPYAIGFVDYYTVKKLQLAQAALRNKDGQCVLPSAGSLTAAAQVFLKRERHLMPTTSNMDLKHRKSFTIWQGQSPGV